jgi:uncharacterized repeat protein (TIGR02543 family)
MKKRTFLMCSFLLFLFSFALIGCDKDANNCTVTFHPNGGVGTVPPISASEGSSITLPSGSGLSRSGYTFGGWNTIAAGKGTNYAAGSSYKVTGNVILYAKWDSSGTEYTVTFNLNYEGSDTAPAPQVATPGSSVTLPTPTRAGYTFDGWNKKADGTGTHYNVSSSYSANDGNITLYAEWVFTVTFDNNGGGSPPSPRKVAPGSSITIPSTSRSGYTFDKWNTAILGTGTEYAANVPFTPTENITLYAQWIGVYTIIFDANGNEGSVSGIGPDPMQVTAGESAAIPHNGTLAIIYTTFTGWNTEPDGTGTAVAANSTYTPPGSITLYAQWSAPSSYASVTGFEDKLTWIQAHAEDNGNYDIQVSGDESINPKVFSGSNVKITLTGSGSNRVVSLSIFSSMFKLNTGVTLTLGNNITLRGRIPNAKENSLIRVMGGTLVMNNGSSITNNTTDCGVGGGVYVGDGGTFTMNGGTIANDNGSVVYGTQINNDGGGVYVDNGATFNMNGGTIDHNMANNRGGGVYVAGSNINGLVPGNFSKTGGTITGYSSGNYLSNNSVINPLLSPIQPQNNRGHAVFVYTGNVGGLHRETTAGPSDNLSYVNGVASGGWE